MSAAKFLLQSLLMTAALFMSGAWGFTLPGQNEGPTFRITLVAPDGNDVYLLSDGFSKEDVIAEMTRAGVPFAATGHCNEDLEDGIDHMEVKFLYERLNSSRQNRNLKEIDKNLLRKIPVCDDNIIHLLILSKVLQGYDLLKVESLKPAQ